MKKFALTTLAVMAAVGVLAVQPADAKKVQQDPSMAIIDMPMNDEIQQVNGVSKSANTRDQNGSCNSFRISTFKFSTLELGFSAHLAARRDHDCDDQFCGIAVYRASNSITAT